MISFINCTTHSVSAYHSAVGEFVRKMVDEHIAYNERRVETTTYRRLLTNRSLLCCTLISKLPYTSKSKIKTPH